MLDVYFSGQLSVGSADDVAAYLLDSPTKSKKLGTRYTKPVPFKTASYNPSANMVTLTPRGTIPAQKMQLTINASLIKDAQGRQLDGNDDGQPGGNYVAILNNHGGNAALPLIRAGRASAKVVDALLANGHLKVR